MKLPENEQIGNIKSALLDLESLLQDKYGDRAHDAIAEIGYIRDEVHWMEQKILRLSCLTMITNAVHARR